MSLVKARAPQAITTPLSYSVNDPFTQAAGGLTGEPLLVGGNWTALPGSDADDFQNVATGNVTRTSTNDAPSGNLFNASEGLIGRAIYASGPSLSAVFFQLDFYVSAGGTDLALGQMLRVVDDSNFAFLRLSYPLLGGNISPHLQLIAASGGGNVYNGPSWTGLTPGLYLNRNAVYTVSALLDGSGHYQVWLNPKDAPLGDPLIQSTTTLLPSAGKVGIFDTNPTSTLCTRGFRNPRAWIPVSEAAIFSGQSARFTHESVFRKSSNGATEGVPPVVEGKHLKLPQSTRAARVSRIVIKSRRGDVDSGQPDTGLTDQLRATLIATPRVDLLSVGGVIGFPVYTLSNITTDHGFNANSTTLDELADNLGTLIGELPVPVGTWTNTSVTTDRTLDCNSTSINELADVLATLIADLGNPLPNPPWTISNATVRRILNANSITLDGLADVLGTLINDLKAAGVL